MLLVFRTLLTIAFINVILSSLALADGRIAHATSIDSINFGPIHALFNIVAGEHAPTTQHQSFSYQAQLEATNYLSLSDLRDDYLFIDGETWSLRQRVSYQHYQWQISAQVPLIYHGPGIFDRAIYRFHDTFNMPQNGRTKTRENEFLLSLRRHNKNILFLDNEAFSFGDLAIGAKYQWANDLTSLGLHLKLPTGNINSLTGSQEVDVAISYSDANPDWLAGRKFLTEQPLSLWWGVGLNYLGHVNKLKTIKQKHWVASTRIGVAWEPLTNLQFKAQLDTHSQVFDSNVRELGWVPLISSFAIAYKSKHKQSYEFSIVEDLRPRVTPDVSLLFKYSRHF